MLLATVLASTVVADTALDPRVEEGTHAISQSIISPFCPGRVLSECPSSQAAELKQEIRTRLGQGEEQQAILDSLYDRYGSEIQAVPSMRGFDLLAWVVPPLFMILGVFLIVIWVRSQRSEESDQ